MKKSLIICLLCLSIMALVSAKPSDNKERAEIKGGENQPLKNIGILGKGKKASSKKEFSRFKVVPDHKQAQSPLKAPSRRKPLDIDNQNTPIEGSPDFVEGDIKIPGNELKKNKNGQNNKARTITWSYSELKWTNNVIPYQINQQQFGKNDQDAIRFAMSLIQSRTDSCITFRERTASDPNYLNIFSGDGCWSFVGSLFNVNTDYAVQDLSLSNPGCMSTGIIVHELLHASGAFHEQSRLDRDNHIDVIFNNVERGYEDNFQKQTDSDTHEIDYDYYSIMHYGAKAFSRNGQDTIIPKEPNVVLLNTYQKSLDQIMTPSDSLMVKKYYGCPTAAQTTTSTAAPTTTSTAAPTTTSTAAPTTTSTAAPTTTSTAAPTTTSTAAPTTTSTAAPTTTSTAAPFSNAFTFSLINDIRGYDLFIYEYIGDNTIEYRTIISSGYLKTINTVYDQWWYIFTDDFRYYTYTQAGNYENSVNGGTLSAWNQYWYYY